MNRTPKLLDLFCKAGGASMGYHRAGFEVVGVDIKKQKRYPFEFLHADALEVLADRDFLKGFDVIAASPPCQTHSITQHLRDAQGNTTTKLDLIPETREALQAWGGHTSLRTCRALRSSTQSRSADLHSG